MKLRWQPLAAITLLPMGIALADYADTASPEPILPAMSAEQRTLLDGAELSLEQVTDGTHELAIAMQRARRNGDSILANCLTDAFESAHKLQGSAIASVKAMQTAATLDAARAVAPNVAATNEALATVLDDASRCESGEREGPAGNSGPTATHVTVDNDPAAGHGQAAPPVLPPSLIPPPAGPQNNTSMDFATDLPMDMPMVPPTASPTR